MNLPLNLDPNGAPPKLVVLVPFGVIPGIPFVAALDPNADPNIRAVGDANILPVNIPVSIFPIPSNLNPKAAIARVPIPIVPIIKSKFFAMKSAILITMLRFFGFDKNFVKLTRNFPKNNVAKNCMIPTKIFLTGSTIF